MLNYSHVDAARRVRSRHVILAAAASFVLVCIHSSVSAEVRVSGTPDRLVLQVRHASLPEILHDLQSASRLEIRLTGAPERQFTGTYTGSLRHVLARLLAGVDYVVNPAPGGLRIKIVGRSATRPVIAAEAADDAASTALAAAAAGHGGSRSSRLRERRVLMQPASAQDRD